MTCSCTWGSLGIFTHARMIPTPPGPGGAGGRGGVLGANGGKEIRGEWKTGLHGWGSRSLSRQKISSMGWGVPADSHTRAPDTSGPNRFYWIKKTVNRGGEGPVIWSVRTRRPCHGGNGNVRTPAAGGDDVRSNSAGPGATMPRTEWTRRVPSVCLRGGRYMSFRMNRYAAPRGWTPEPPPFLRSDHRREPVAEGRKERSARPPTTAVAHRPRCGTTAVAHRPRVADGPGHRPPPPDAAWRDSQPTAAVGSGPWR